jgi:TetR/AcrR family transcriptional regulator, transcriptional repressor for nem operon
MPRAAAHTIDELIDSAMRHFWRHGYHATSMDDLIEATGSSRHAIYSSVGSKHELYRRGFAAYRNAIVDPAFACVEAQNANLEAIGNFFEIQIALAERAGLPGPGCLIANATTETAPHDAQISAEVAAHNKRLKAGFARALANEARGLPQTEIDALANFLVTTAQGLWSMSRTVSSAAPLRAHVSTLMSLLRRRSTP